MCHPACLRTADAEPFPSAGPGRPSRSPGRAGRWRPTDAGYATAEAALALPSLLVVLAVAVWVLACVGAQLRCVDAARVAARVAARGDSTAASAAAGRAAGPRGASVRITSTGSRVLVVVRAEVRPFGAALHVPCRSRPGRWRSVRTPRGWRCDPVPSRTAPPSRDGGS